MEIIIALAVLVIIIGGIRIVFPRKHKIKLKIKLKEPKKKNKKPKVKIDNKKEIQFD